MKRHYIVFITTLVYIFSTNVRASNNPRLKYEVPSKKEVKAEDAQPTPTTADSFHLQEPESIKTKKPSFFPTSRDEVRILGQIAYQSNSDLFSALKVEASFADSNYTSWVGGVEIQFRSIGSLNFERSWKFFSHDWFPFADLGVKLHLHPDRSLSNFIAFDQFYAQGTLGLEKFLTPENKLILELNGAISTEFWLITIGVGYTFPL